MDTIILKVSKKTETGKEIAELEARRKLMVAQAKELAEELGFEYAWVTGGEFRGRVIGFTGPNENVDLKGYCKPNEHRILKPRTSQKEIWEKINKIGFIGFEELHEIIGISLQVYQNVGYEELTDCFIITIDKEWKSSLKENIDFEEIKKSEYYLMKGE